MNIKYIRYIFWLLSCILMVGLWYQYKESLVPTARVHNQEGTQMGSLNIGGPFKLKNQDGKTINSEDSKNKVRIVYFGYTYCPDLCPLALANITQAIHLLKRDKDRVETYFITIDPKRDTQEKLKEYHTNFHPNIHMLWGSHEALKPIMASYKVFAQKVEDDSMSDYLVDHSTFIYILNKKGEVVDVMPHTTPGDEIFRSINNQLFQQK